MVVNLHLFVPLLLQRHHEQEDNACVVGGFVNATVTAIAWCLAALMPLYLFKRIALTCDSDDRSTVQDSVVYPVEGSSFAGNS
jgi:hypothetical protein